MGDMADLILASCDPYMDEGYDGDSYYPRSYKTCWYCGEPGLGWVTKVNGKWKLGDPWTMRIHVCDPAKIKEKNGKSANYTTKKG